MKRKDFIQSAGTLVAAGLISPLAETDSYKKPIRVAHLSDIHLKPGLIPEKGMASVFHHVQNLKSGVDFIINNGDSIMDALEAGKEKTATQWQLFTGLLQKENQLPVYHSIGNHDIWGWFIKTERPENDPLYGKAWVLEQLKMSGRYYRFTKNNWHFVVLDSTQLNPAGGYIARLDPQQLEWLQLELKAIPSDEHICIISHIPILSICAGLFFDKTEANGDLLLKRNLMHSDFLVLKKIFLQYPNIRTCISGHIHLQDELEYLGIKYFCNGAVSGNWWSGAFQEFKPAYAFFEFFPNGGVKRKMMNYDDNR